MPKTAEEKKQMPKTAEEKKQKIKSLPPWKVILENDNFNDATYIALTVHRLTPLDSAEAKAKTIEAHTSGKAILLTTHKEKAELYQEQFASCRPPIGIIIEPN